MIDQTEAWPYLEAYFAGAYWGPRKESPEECARRTAALLELLAPCDPFLAHWYQPVRSRKHPLTPPEPILTELFRQGVNCEEGGPVFEHLGFSVWFGNGGGSYDRASLRIFCGGYAPGHSNSCVLSLPTPGRSPNADRMLTVSVLTSVVRAMVLAWEPDSAVVMSNAHLSMSAKEDTWIGWVTYLSRQRGTVPPLPAPVRIEPVEDRGTLILLTPERFTVANPEHVALARRVRALLEPTGLLRRSLSDAPG